MKKVLIFLCYSISLCVLNSSEISYSPDEKYAAVISNDGKIKICETKLEIKKNNLPDIKKEPGLKLVFDPIFELQQTDSNFACAVSWSCDGKILACGSSGGIVDLWSVENIEQIKFLKTLKISDCLDAISVISWSGDNKFLAMILKDLIVKVWGDFEQNLGMEKFSFDLSECFKEGTFQVDTLDWSPCGKFLAISCGSTNKKIDSIILDVSKIYEKVESTFSFTHQKPKHQLD